MLPYPRGQKARARQLRINQTDVEAQNYGSVCDLGNSAGPSFVASIPWVRISLTFAVPIVVWLSSLMVVSTQSKRRLITSEPIS